MRNEIADVTVSALTLGPVGFEDRVAAAALAGFSAIGLSTEQYMADHRNGMNDRRMMDILAAHSIRLSEVEFLSNWGATPTPGEAESNQKESAAFHIAKTFGADRINAGLFNLLSLDSMAEKFAALCQRASGLRIALEFMPFGIPNLRAAWEIVRCSGAQNGGLLIDIWHWVRSGMTSADLQIVPVEKVYGIQICDVGPSPLADQRYESLHHRLVPGRGAGNVVDVLRLFANQGLAAPISAEVMSDALLAKGTLETAKAVYAGVSSVVAASGYLPPETAVG